MRKYKNIIAMSMCVCGLMLTACGNENKELKQNDVKTTALEEIISKETSSKEVVSEQESTTLPESTKEQETTKQPETTTKQETTTVPEITILEETTTALTVTALELNDPPKMVHRSTEIKIKLHCWSECRHGGTISFHFQRG